MNGQEYILKELYLGTFMVQKGYMSQEEYLENLVDYNLIIIEYSLKLGQDSFKQSILFYVKQINKKNLFIKNKISYLTECLKVTCFKREIGQYK